MSLRSMVAVVLTAVGVLAGMTPAQAYEGETYSIRALQDTRYAIELDSTSYEISFRNREANRNDLQLWVESASSSGYFMLKNKARPSLCLAIPAGDSTARVFVWPCNTSILDHWWTWIRGVNSGGQQLQSLATDRVASPTNPQLLDGAGVIQRDAHTVASDLVKRS